MSSLSRRKLFICAVGKHSTGQAGTESQGTQLPSGADHTASNQAFDGSNPLPSKDLPSGDDQQPSTDPCGEDDWPAARPYSGVGYSSDQAPSKCSHSKDNLFAAESLSEDELPPSTLPPRTPTPDAEEQATYQTPSDADQSGSKDEQPATEPVSEDVLLSSTQPSAGASSEQPVSETLERTLARPQQQAMFRSLGTAAEHNSLSQQSYRGGSPSPPVSPEPSSYAPLRRRQACISTYHAMSVG